MAILYLEMLREPLSEGLERLIVVEEVEEVFPASRGSGSALASSLIRARKRGTGLVFVAHSSSTIDQNILKGTANIVAFTHVNVEDATLIAGILGDPSLRATLQILSRGEAIVRAASQPQPFLLRVAPLAGENLRLRRALLQSIRTYPFLGARERRSLLGLDSRAYRRLVQDLISDGLIEEVEVYTGGPGRPKKLLNPRGANPSIPHQYILRLARERLEKLEGATVGVGRPGEPDLIVSYGGARIAVEVETGSNLDLGKILRRAREGYDLVILVCAVRRACRRARRVAGEALRLGVEARVASVYHLLSTIREAVGGGLVRG